MSTVAISYRSLRDSSNEANAVARRLNQYGDSLYRNVYNKLNQYGGEWTENINSAIQRTNEKINSLHEQANRYQSYSYKLTSLQDECRSVDRAVRSKVSELTLDYKQSHGIRNSVLENFINYFNTKFNNDSWLGRAWSDLKNKFETGMKKLKDSIKEWYNYGGGKQLIKGVISSISEIALAVAAILAPGASLLAIIGGQIVIANALVNLRNEMQAYAHTSNGDPAMAKRRSDLDTLTDTIRTDSDDKNAHLIANGLDILKYICDASSFLHSAKDLVKNGYKWATGNAAKLSDIKLKEIFSKNTFNKIKQNFGDYRRALQYNNWSIIKDITSSAWDAFKSNLKDTFWNFSKPSKILGSMKNLIGIPKDLFKNGLSLENIKKVLINDIFAKGFAVFSMKEEGSNEQKYVTIDDISGLFEKGNKLFTKSSIMEKLSLKSNTNVSIPKVEVPQIMIHSYA